MDIDKLISKNSFGLNVKGEKIKEKIEAYDARININGTSRILSAYLPLSSEEVRRKSLMYSNYITNNTLRDNLERAEILKKWLDYPNQTKLENLVVEIEENAEEFYDNFSKDLYETLKENFKETYVKSKKEIVKKLVHNPYYNESAIQISDDYFDKFMSERYGKDDISFDEAIKARKTAFKSILKERISNLILLETTNGSLINFIIDDIIKNEKLNVERFSKNEIVKIENKAKMKSYSDLGIINYIVEEDDDEKICKKCSEQNRRIYPLSEFEIGKNAPPFHINCRGTIEPKIEKEIEEKIADNFTNPLDKAYNKHTEDEKLFSNWIIIEPDSEGTAESQELNSSEIFTTPTAYIEYIKNRTLTSNGNYLDLKRRYAIKFPELDEIMSYVTPVEKGESDTLDNLNNKDYQAAYKKYLKKAQSENRSTVNYNTFLNTVLPVIDKIKRNRAEIYKDIIEYYIDTDTDTAEKYIKKAAEYTDPLFTATEIAPLILAKKIYDKIFYFIPSLVDSFENSLIDDELEKDHLLDEEDSKSTDINEIFDMAANAVAEAVVDSLDFVNIGGQASEVSRNLYSAAKKEASKEVKKEIVKDASEEAGKQILKKETSDIFKNATENILGEKEKSKNLASNLQRNTDNLISENRIKISEKNVQHIFRNSEGHLLEDTPQNRRLLENTANNEKKFLGLDMYGNKWYAETLEDGRQIWAQVRNGEIRNGGINNPPKTYNPKTGLSSPDKPKGGNEK